MTLLSTGFLIDLMRRDASAIELLRRLERSSNALRVPAVVYQDLWEAAARSRHPPADLDRLERLLGGYAPVAVGPRHGMQAGRVAARHALGLRDAWLAGIALVERDELVVRDVRPFEAIDGLRLVTY